MIFKGNKFKTCDYNFSIGMHKIEMVKSFKYLGFLLNDNLNEKDDILHSRNKFYREFNSTIRKFSFAHQSVLIHLLFKFLWLSVVAKIQKLPRTITKIQCGLP